MATLPLSDITLSFLGGWRVAAVHIGGETNSTRTNVSALHPMRGISARPKDVTM
jgi:hypothetical protein